MAYQKIPSRNFAALKIILGFAVLLVLLVAVIVVWFSRSNIASEPTVRAGSVGEIARLSGDELVPSSSDNAPNMAPQTTSGTSSTDDVLGTQTELSSDPYTMDLPSGWSKTSTKESQNPCDTSLTQTVTVYAKDKETITVYENGSPTGCDNNTIGDVFYGYDFSTDGKSIAVDTAINPPFCTKDQNATCPKGDGKVTVFVGNVSSSDPGELVKSSITGKTYYFTIVDSGLESNLDAQGASLAQLVESIQIN